MSNLKLKTTSGGSVQLTPTDTASNVVLTLPASNTTLVGADSLASPAGSSLAGYLPTGVGAVATTVQAKLREIVSITDFAADPSGVSSTSIAIGSTDTASRTNGSGSFEIPAGVFYIGSTVTLTGPSGYFKITGAGRHRTMLVIANDTTGLDLNIGALVLKDMSIVSKAWYDAWVASGYTSSTATDTSGIGVKIGGGFHFENLVIYGFGGSGVQQPTGYSSIKSEFEHMRVQYCGKGLDLNSGTGGNVTTTSRIKDVYITACTTGLYMRNWAHGVIDNLICEYNVLGADISGNTNLDIRKWYFENNTTPYSLVGVTASIIDETLVTNTNPPVLTYDQGSYGLIPFPVGAIQTSDAYFGRYALRGIQGATNARAPLDMFIELQNITVPRVLKTTARTATAAASAIGVMQQSNAQVVNSIKTKSHNIFSAFLTINGVTGGTIGTESSGGTTSGSPNITFTAGGVAPIAGQMITGTGIPTGTVVVSKTTTSAVLSQNATASNTGLTFTAVAAAVISDDKNIFISKAATGVYDVAFNSGIIIDELSVQAIEPYVSATAPTRLSAFATIVNTGSPNPYTRITTQNGLATSIRVEIWSGLAGAVVDGDFFIRIAGRLSDE